MYCFALRECVLLHIPLLPNQSDGVGRLVVSSGLICVLVERVFVFWLSFLLQELGTVSREALAPGGGYPHVCLTIFAV